MSHPYDIHAPISGAPNFALRELLRSSTAEKLKIDNTPHDIKVYSNLAYLAVQCLQPARNHFDTPIVINSGYRSPKLNQAVGGSTASFHSHGMAADVMFRDHTISLWNLFEFYYQSGHFTELIAEELSPSGGGWIHVAIAKGREMEGQLKYKLVGQGVKRASFEEIHSILRMY